MDNDRIMDLMFCGRTDMGRKRTNNEDAFAVQYLWDREHILAVVIDGVGGYEGGEVAAELARKNIVEYLENYGNGERLDLLKQAVIQANNAIFSARKELSQYAQMSCVLTAVLVELRERRVNMAHVGDTRLYQYADGDLVKLSHDHSLVGYREEIGELSEEEAMRHPQRNVIGRDVGSVFLENNTDDYVETAVFPLLPGSVLLLCSDGLCDMLTSVQMAQVLARYDALGDKANALVREANEAGGKDNVTVVLVEAPAEDPADEAAVPGVSVEPEPEPQEPGTGKSRRRRWWLVVLLAVLAALVSAGVLLWYSSVSPVRAQSGAEYLETAREHLRNGLILKAEICYNIYTRMTSGRVAGFEYEIGVCFRDGRGTDRDPVKAEQWLKRSAELGYTPAADALAQLSEATGQPGTPPAAVADSVRPGAPLPPVADSVSAAAEAAADSLNVPAAEPPVLPAKTDATVPEVPEEEASAAPSVAGTWVDLGLRVKWAACNIGADRPSEAGSRYAWGEVETKEKYRERSSRTYNRNVGEVAGNLAYDVALAEWGSSWRLPTLEEMKELRERCRWDWTREDGVSGYRVTGPNGNSIFLPAAGRQSLTAIQKEGEYGYYWTGTPERGNAQRAYCLFFKSEYTGMHWSYRGAGMSVRAVCD